MNTYLVSSSCATAPSSTDLPEGFDPEAHPILARHWFGVHPHGVSTLWWHFAGLGHRLPAEPDEILIDGGRR
jgi:hypothetical protein